MASVITAHLQVHSCQSSLLKSNHASQKKERKGSCCGVRRWDGQADPRLANLEWDLMTGPPWGFCMVNNSQSSPTAELAHFQDSHTTAPAELDCLLWAERYLASPYILRSSHTVFINSSGLKPHHSLVRLVVVRLMAERSGGCVLWVSGNGLSFSGLAVWPQTHAHLKNLPNLSTHGVL